MVTFVLVFGTMWLGARYLSAALPSGFWFSLVAAIICIIAAIPVGLGVGIIMNASGLDKEFMKPGEYYLDGIRIGFLAIFSCRLSWLSIAANQLPPQDEILTALRR